jgi:hypothetical protein
VGPLLHTFRLAAREGLVWADAKPENVLVDVQQGACCRVVCTDFGNELGETVDGACPEACFVLLCAVFVWNTQHIEQGWTPYLLHFEEAARETLRQGPDGVLEEVRRLVRRNTADLCTAYNHYVLSGKKDRSRAEVLPLVEAHLETMVK